MKNMENFKKSKKAKNIKDTEQKTNYEIATENAAKLFLSHPLEEIISQKGFDAHDGYIWIRFLGIQHRISLETGLCEFEDADGSFKPQGHGASMTLYDIICYSKTDCKTSGQYISFPNLARVHNSNSYAGQGMFSDSSRLFDTMPEKLEQACIALGGVKAGKGDVTYKIPLFEHHGQMDCIIDFWCADEDFPAQLTILCDLNTLDYMHYETIWFMAGYIIRKIEELM